MTDNQSSCSNPSGIIDELGQALPLHKVSQRQWDAAQRAIGAIEEHQVPKEVRRLQQCRATRTSRQLIVTTAGAAAGGSTRPPDYERIIQKATETEECDSVKEKEMLMKTVPALLGSIGRFACPTDDDETVLALPEIPLITPGASKELHLQNDERDNDSDNTGNDSSSCSADDSEEEDYDSDELDVLFLDKKAVERVMELRLKTRMASESMATSRAALSGMVRNLHSLEQEMLSENDVMNVDCIKLNVSSKTAKEVSPPRAIAKPKNLFAILGLMDDTYDECGFDLGAGSTNIEPPRGEMEDNELERKIKNLKTSLQRKDSLLQKVERTLPGAVENTFSTKQVVEAYIQKTAFGRGASNSIEKTLFSPDRKKRGKPTTVQDPTAKKQKLITPECRFLDYLQGI